MDESPRPCRIVCCGPEPMMEAVAETRRGAQRAVPGLAGNADGLRHRHLLQLRGEDPRRARATGTTAAPASKGPVFDAAAHRVVGSSDEPPVTAGRAANGSDQIVQRSTSASRRARLRVFCLAALMRGREPRLHAGGQVGVHDALGGGLVDALGGQTELGLGRRRRRRRRSPRALCGPAS